MVTGCRAQRNSGHDRFIEEEKLLANRSGMVPIQDRQVECNVEKDNDSSRNKNSFPTSPNWALFSPTYQLFLSVSWPLCL